MRILGVIAGMASALFVPAASAQEPAAPTQELNPCIFDLPCIGGGAEGFGAFVEDAVAPYMLLLFVGISICAFFYYAFRLVTESRENESAIKESKDGFTQLLYACAIVGIGTILVATFGSEASQTIINPEPLQGALAMTTFFFRILVGVTLTAIIVAQGFLLIISSEDGEIDKHRKRLMNAILGVAIILLANALVAALQPGSNAGILANEVRGIANYILVFFILMSVIAIIVAGAFYLLSVNEDLKEKAKAIIKTVVVAVVVVLCSYVIVFYFINL